MVLVSTTGHNNIAVGNTNGINNGFYYKKDSSSKGFSKYKWLI